jgi:EpsI family protein
MGEAITARPAGLISKEQIWIAAAVAIVIYIVLDQIDGFIALPLRESSSRISAWILNALSIKTVRTGTILSTESFTFDVVPACSGSTTLRVLLTLGAIWCAIHPGLTLARRLLCAAFVIPIALVANGVRVAALVGLGDVFLKPVEGVPHALVGLLGFALAMSTLYLLTEMLSMQARGQPVELPLKLVLLGLAVLVLYTPVLIWMLNGWATGPLELISALFIITVAGLLVLFARRLPTVTTGGWGAFALFAFSVFALARATFLDVRTVEGWCLLLTIFSLLWLFKGVRFAVCSSLLLLIIPLAFPTVSTAIAGLTSRLIGVERPVFGLLVRLTAAAGLVAFSWLLFTRKNVHGLRRSIPPMILNLVIFVAAIGVLFQTHFNSKAAGFDKERQLELSYIQGEWLGVDAQVSDVALEQIGRDRIISRRYQHNQQTVDVIVTTTGADRRRAHPPEWCMTGVGWTVQSRELVHKRLTQHEVPMTRMIFRKEGAELEFYYWFSDGQRQYATHNEMMREDLVRRLKGERTNWMLLRIIAPKDSTYLDAFMSGLEPSVARLVNKPA